MSKIEYESVKVSEPIKSHRLNRDYANKGWELVTVLTLPDGFEYIFKRVEVTYTIQMNSANIEKERLDKVFKEIQRSKVFEG